MIYKDETNGIRQQSKRTDSREHSVPMYLTSSFMYESAEQAEAVFSGQEEAYVYSRFSNPNVTELIDKMCSLEGAEAGEAMASGMATVFNTLAAHLQSGDELVVSNALFGNTSYIVREILPKWGVKTHFVDLTDQDAWEASITSDTKMVLVETPSNPGLELVDIDWLAGLCKQYEAILVVDNCFATPILQKPLYHGADLSIHSATKWIDGQGRVLGGVVVGKAVYVKPIHDFLRRTGACMSPFNAWILSKSLETLAIRMKGHCANALALAQFLEEHPDVERVQYPFLPSHPQHDLAKRMMTMGGGIVTFNTKGNKETCFQFINYLKLLSLTANLGDTRTTITHPATTTHQKLSTAAQRKLGIGPTTVRISVGLEHIDDIISDIVQAFDKIRV